MGATALDKWDFEFDCLCPQSVNPSPPHAWWLFSIELLIFAANGMSKSDCIEVYHHTWWAGRSVSRSFGRLVEPPGRYRAPCLTSSSPTAIYCVESPRTRSVSAVEQSIEPRAWYAFRRVKYFSLALHCIISPRTSCR